MQSTDALSRAEALESLLRDKARKTGATVTRWLQEVRHDAEQRLRAAGLASDVWKGIPLDFSPLRNNPACAPMDVWPYGKVVYALRDAAPEALRAEWDRVEPALRKLRSPTTTTTTDKDGPALSELEWLEPQAPPEALQAAARKFTRRLSSLVWAAGLAAAADMAQRTTDPDDRLLLGGVIERFTLLMHWPEALTLVPRAGGKARSAGKPAATSQRNKDMIEDYDRAVVSDHMGKSAALQYAANKAGMSPEGASRIIKPSKRWPMLRAVLAKPAR